MDEANLEPKSSVISSAAEAARAEVEAAAAKAAAAQEQLFWVDAPLLLVELLWGLLRCAAVIPTASSTAAPTGQLSSQPDLLGRVHTLLEGSHGLFEAVLGVQCLAVAQDADSLTEPALSAKQQDEAEAVGALEHEVVQEASCNETESDGVAAGL
jgi:hypothetical protein